MIKFLDLNSQYKSIKKEIDFSIFEVIKNASFIKGEFLQKFEKEFADYLKIQNCIGVGNGTDALEIAIESLNLAKGSEVLVPSNSFISTSEAVTRQGLSPVFVKFDETNYTISTSDILEKINSKTKAIIAVHLYGHPCDMDTINKIAKKNKLFVIEDCAQSHGAKYQGNHTGTFGDIATFSFYPGKNLGAYGDAGAIVTNNQELANKCRKIGDHGRLSKYDHEFEGRNSRLDGIQSSILSVKLKYLDKWIRRRNEIAKFYFENLSDIREINLPNVNENVIHAFHLFVIRTKNRDNLKKFLYENEIETGIHYPILLPDLIAYNTYNKNDTLIQKEIPNELLSLPIGEHLTETELIKINNCIHYFYQK